MANPDKKEKFLGSMRDEYGAGNNPPTINEGEIARRIKNGEWGKVEQAFAGLSIDEAGAVLERVGQGLSVDNHRQLMDVFTGGVKTSLARANETETKSILAGLRKKS